MLEETWKEFQGWNQVQISHYNATPGQTDPIPRNEAINEPQKRRPNSVPDEVRLARLNVQINIARGKITDRRIGKLLYVFQRNLNIQWIVLVF